MSVLKGLGAGVEDLGYDTVPGMVARFNQVGIFSQRG